MPPPRRALPALLRQTLKYALDQYVSNAGRAFQLGHVVSQTRLILPSVKAAINTTSIRVGASPGRLVVIHTRPATCDYLGSIDQGITYSPQSLLLCNDIAAMLRAMWQGTEVNDDTLALDLTREIGLFGTVLGHPHTARHCRTGLWDSPYFGANEPLATTDKPDEDLFARIDRDLRVRLAAPGPRFSKPPASSCGSAD